MVAVDYHINYKTLSTLQNIQMFVATISLGLNITINKNNEMMFLIHENECAKSIKSPLH